MFDDDTLKAIVWPRKEGGRGRRGRAGRVSWIFRFFPSILSLKVVGLVRRGLLVPLSLGISQH